ncbi:MAG: SUMF1/EgtB/PvdO family nonheme iron enzyme [Saprospiraceae bacterium]
MEETLVEAILKVVPLEAWSKYLGISKDWLTVVFLISLGLIIWGLYRGSKKLLELRKNLKAAKDLKPQFDYQMLQQATRIYIPTKYQNASPARQDEPGFTHQYVATNSMIPFFLKKAFNEKTDGERFYLILADSGMGKTTFMINLYLAYHSFFNRRKYQMRLLRFSHPDTLDEIKAISKDAAKNTILLLDALDEDPNIVSKDPGISDAQAFQNRVDVIIEATRNFCEVVMTCRTQYFPGQEDDPYELKVKRPDEKGYYRLNKLYVSPFTDLEVKQYLNKKYGYLPIWNRWKKERALQIVNKSRHLVMRPMMLSYIDLLVRSERNFKTDYDIYETLVEQWLIREGEKRRNTADRDAFINSLRQVSQQTAMEIWEIWQREQRLYLTKTEAVAIAEKNNIELKPEEVTGQSLLTCDGTGNWKFAHKSVLEFFLAKEWIENSKFRDFDFAAMDMAEHFIEEKLIVPEGFVIVWGGAYTMGSEEEGVPHEVKVNTFMIGKYPVTQEEYTKTSCKPNPSHFEGNKNPVEQVNWMDAIEYCNLLSKKNGIPVAYNEQGNLLDASGKVTKDVLEVRGLRLPTEAEWEYAARGGRESKGYQYIGSNDLKEVAWYRENSDGKTHPVGVLKPNELILYDLSGNVWEWCQDWYDEKYYEFCKKNGVAVNPLGPYMGIIRVFRGGGWYAYPQYCRVAFRYGGREELRYSALGFRLALSVSG